MEYSSGEPSRHLMHSDLSAVIGTAMLRAQRNPLIQLGEGQGQGTPPGEETPRLS